MRIHPGRIPEEAVVSGATRLSAASLQLTGLGRVGNKFPLVDSSYLNGEVGVGMLDMYV